MKEKITKQHKENGCCNICLPCCIKRNEKSTKQEIDFMLLEELEQFIENIGWNTLQL
jgi:hypothetical protein